MLDDRVLVPGLLFLYTVELVLGFSGKFKSDWSSEGDLRSDLVLSLDVSALFDCLGSVLSLDKDD